MRIVLRIIKNLLYISLIAWCIWYALLYIVPGFLQYIILPVFVIWFFSKFISAIFDDKEKKHKNKNYSEKTQGYYDQQEQSSRKNVFDTDFEEDKNK